MSFWLTLASCSGMSSRDKSTAIAAVGAAVLNGGSAIGTVGGAIGNQIGK